MGPTKRGLIVAVAALLCRVVTSDLESLNQIIEIKEFDQEEQCRAEAEADWNELLNKPGAFIAKLEREKARATVTASSIYDLKVESKDYNLSPDNLVVNRKLDLMLAPGDSLLQIDQWNRLISFADEAIHKLETARDYDCGTDAKEHCTLSDVHRRLGSPDTSAEARRRVHDSWARKLPSASEYVSQILPLLSNASKVNGFDTVEQYWESLVDYEDALRKARELWSHVQPLYEQLQKHVLYKLQADGLPINPDNSIPVSSLGSLLGEDWSNVAEIVLPKHIFIYKTIQKNLRSKNTGGREAFLKAAKLVKDLSLGDLNERFWKESVFDKTCPTKLVDLCVDGAMRVFTCNDISLGNYLDAHEAVMKVKYKEMEASYSNNTYILRHPERYSAVYEGISGLGSLLALTPLQLDKAKIFSHTRFMKNYKHYSVALQMYMALRDLPRLNYYLAADEWRLRTLRSIPAPIPIGRSWSDFRRKFSLVQPGDTDFLGDPNILLNKPYLANFFGIILKYQIYDSFTDYVYQSPKNVMFEMSKNSHRILEPMTRAFSVKWPELVSDIVAKKEYVVDSNGLANYFSLLHEYLQESSDPSNTIADSFEHPDPSDLFETTSEKQSEEVEDERANDIDNIEALVGGNRQKEDIREHTDSEKEDIRENSENVLANKHLIPKEEEATSPLQNEGEINEAASNSTYIWIGIGVVLAIIIILVSIIVKKRINHRNQLENERRQQSKA